ncbi:hypothetical protein APHMUC_0389 [Anaplasma phagocytophilum str. ApMUC09]|uniref:Uncharacterized protein n=2 Tax=Anaplasma phagocytophilum TaxID=948 RepID=A0A098EG22_ANAPH|nr:hypothetical protein APHMUC_0389 [Anaplasma phagocytophilum str. ApMUC09]CEG20730.1 Protein of unknown function [Anaplasma phagocytophilum]
MSVFYISYVEGSISSGSNLQKRETQLYAQRENSMNAENCKIDCASYEL